MDGGCTDKHMKDRWVNRYEQIDRKIHGQMNKQRKTDSYKQKKKYMDRLTNREKQSVTDRKRNSWKDGQHRGAGNYIQTNLTLTYTDGQRGGEQTFTGNR